MLSVCFREGFQRLPRQRVCSLKWSDTSWEDKRITLVGKGQKIVVRLSRPIEAILSQLRAEPHHPTGRVFRNTRLEPISYRAFYAAFVTARRQAGVTNLRVHDRRHTAATRITEQTGDIRIAQKLLNHSSISSTARYAHILDDDLRKAMDEMV